MCSIGGRISRGIETGPETVRFVISPRACRPDCDALISAGRNWADGSRTSGAKGRRDMEILNGYDK